MHPIVNYSIPCSLTNKIKFMDKNAKIPENYQTVMPYVIVKGAAKFISFMQTVFDATET